MKEYSFCKIQDSITGNKALIFIQYPYLFNQYENAIVGKCIFVSEPYLKDYKIKLIEGESFSSIKDKIVNGEYIISYDSEMATILKEHLPNCVYSHQKKNVFVADLSIINKDCIKKDYDPIEVKNTKIKKDKELKVIIDGVAKNLGIAANDIGITGSLLFCDLDAVGDIDLVPYISPENAKQAFKRILMMDRDPSIPTMYNIKWPLQYYDKRGNLICLFFSYSSPTQSPLYNWESITLQHTIYFDGIVIEDEHGLYAPTIIRIDKPNVDLLILGTACRGFFKKGDKIKGVGRFSLLRLNNITREFIIISDPWQELVNFP